MASNTSIQTKNRNGESISLHHTQTDSPILPVASLRQLHEFRPDLVDFVVQQTKIESEERRKQNSKINNFIFIEHILGIIFAFLIVLFGIGVGTYLIINEHGWEGVAVMGTPLITIVGMFLEGKRRKSRSEREEQNVQMKKRKR